MGVYIIGISVRPEKKNYNTKKEQFKSVKVESQKIESRYKYRYYQLDDINITINYIDCCRYTMESCGDLDAIITQKLS